MRFFTALRSRFFVSDKPELHVAVLSPCPSGTTERYINLTLQALRSSTDRHLVITQYDNIDTATFSALARDTQEQHFDAILAIGRKPTIQARRLYTERGIFIPTLIIAHEELIPSPLPKHMSGLTIANAAPMTHELLRRCFPQTNTVIICADTTILKNVRQVTELTKRLKQEGIQVHHVSLNQKQKVISDEIKKYASPTSTLILPNDSLAFHLMPDLVNLARSCKYSILASELYALSFNTDIALGYPLEAIANETAQNLLSIIKQPSNRGFHPFQATPEIHCRANSNVDWLKSLVTQDHQYNFKIIGTTDNEQSEPNSQSIQKQ